MRFRKFRRFVQRLFDHSGNQLLVGTGSVCEFPKGAVVMDTKVRINGKANLIVEPGVCIRNSSFQIDSGSTVRVLAGTCLENVDICVWNHSDLSIGKDCRVNNVNFVISKGIVLLEDWNVLSCGGRSEKAGFTIMDGSLSVGDHNQLQNSIWIRFGGSVSIGRYNCINAGSEIRCDESVRIGSYNMVSYDCDIWDTNTHSFYSLEQKMEMFMKDFPQIGNERNKPLTKPVVIGDGNWVGKRACILKGSILGNETVVGTRAIVSNCVVGNGQKVVPSKSEIWSVLR